MLKALIKSLEKNPSILRPSSPTKLERIHIIKNFISKRIQGELNEPQTED
jgi:hypothetical protein